MLHKDHPERQWSTGISLGWHHGDFPPHIAGQVRCPPLSQFGKTDARVSLGGSSRNFMAGPSNNYNLKSETGCLNMCFLSTITLKSEGLACSSYYRRQHASNSLVVLTSVLPMLWGSSRYIYLPGCLPHDTIRPLKTETPHGGWFLSDFQIQSNGSDFQ